jgi:hypothetical protein
MIHRAMSWSKWIWMPKIRLPKASHYLVSIPFFSQGFTSHSFDRWCARSLLLSGHFVDVAVKHNFCILLARAGKKTKENKESGLRGCEHYRRNPMKISPKNPQALSNPVPSETGGVPGGAQVPGAVPRECSLPTHYLVFLSIHPSGHGGKSLRSCLLYLD